MLELHLISPFPVLFLLSISSSFLLSFFFYFLFQGPPSKDSLQMNTYVALYRFIPQENEDLEMR